MNANNRRRTDKELNESILWFRVKVKLKVIFLWFRFVDHVHMMSFYPIESIANR